MKVETFGHLVLDFLAFKDFLSMLHAHCPVRSKNALFDRLNILRISTSI